MRLVTTMLLEGVIMYVGISNFAITLFVLKIIADIPMFSWAAIGTGFLSVLVMSILFVIFVILSGKNITKTGYVPFPFVVVSLNEDYYNEDVQRKVKASLKFQEPEEIELELEDIEIDENQ
jgi:hypothetical protein